MSQSVRLGLLSAFRRLLQPLIRILIRNGVSYYEFNEVVKGVFVEVAERDFNLPGREPSPSRIAILTGLSRKEVVRQRRILASGNLFEAASNLDRVTRVLVGWHSDPEFTGPDRKSTRLNSSHVRISYAVFCLKKKKRKKKTSQLLAHNLNYT